MYNHCYQANIIYIYLPKKLFDLAERFPQALLLKIPTRHRPTVSLKCFIGSDSEVPLAVATKTMRCARSASQLRNVHMYSFAGIALFFPYRTSQSNVHDLMFRVIALILVCSFVSIQT